MKLDAKDIKDLKAYLYDNGDTPSFLYEYYSEQMPYGTRKARDGDPDNWLADRQEQIEDDFSDYLLDDSQIKRLKEIEE